MREDGMAVSSASGGGGIVMVVDHDALAQSYVRSLLASKGYQVVSVWSAAEALARLRGGEACLPEAIVLDLHFLDMLGLEALATLKSDTRLAPIPVLVVTGDSECANEALALGAAGAIVRSFASVWAAGLSASPEPAPAGPFPRLLPSLGGRRRAQAGRSARTQERTEDILATLACAFEARDASTQFHTSRVAFLAEEAGRALGLDSSAELHTLRLGGYLHDIGKRSISSAILNKPGPLNDEEWAQVRQHPVCGYEYLKPHASLRDILPAVKHHHERWDGSGYPCGLAGQSIPLSARVVGLADCFDALTTDRPYRKAFSHEQAVAMLEGKTLHWWDPQVLEAFLGVLRNPMLMQDACAAAG